MQLKDYFPNFYSDIELKDAQGWNKEANLENLEDIELLYELFRDEIDQLHNELIPIEKKGELILNDLSNLIKQFPENKILFKYLRFVFSAIVAMFAINQKMLNNSYDWICNSISDNVSKEKARDIEMSAIDPFIHSRNKFIRQTFDDIFLDWTTSLFYYSRSVGGLKELCNFVLVSYFENIEFYIYDNHYYMGLSNALFQINTWCEKNKKKAFEINCQKLLAYIYKNSTDKHIKFRIAFYFSGLNNTHIKETKQEWIQIILDEYPAFLYGHEKMQFAINRYGQNISDIENNFDDIQESIDQYQEFLVSKQLSDTGRSYELARIYSILFPILHILLLNGKTSLIINLISSFFAIDPTKVLSHNVLFIVPNSENGFLYCLKDQVIVANGKFAENVAEITLALNAFLGTANTIDDDPDFILEAPYRLGAPDKTKGEEVYNLLIENINLKSLADHTEIRNIKGLQTMYGNQLPIQPLIVKELGVTIPIVQSFNQPLQQRPIKNIFIWQGQTNLSEIETIGLAEIFKREDIKVTILKAEASSLAEFSSNFENNEYDLIWISCHGEFDHYEAHKSFLDLGDGLTIGLSDLRKTKNSDSSRRLIVLDACDGATTAFFNSPTSIGIGATLVSDSQSLISHSWPVDNYAGMILGIILAIYLSQGFNYAEAHAKSIHKFIEGRGLVHEFVSKYCQNEDVLERIQNAPIEFNEFYYWGSLTYVE